MDFVQVGHLITIPPHLCHFRRFEDLYIYILKSLFLHVYFYKTQAFEYDILDYDYSFTYISEMLYVLIFYLHGICVLKLM